MQMPGYFRSFKDRRQRLMRIGKTLSPVVAFSSSSHLHQRSVRYAVLGAGFAGLSVAWNLLEHSPMDLHLCIDVLDDVGIGGGASGVSGGLLHPYSPKVKPLWRASECWEESLKLLTIVETAIQTKESSFNNGEHSQSSYGFIARRRGILRPTVSLKNMSIMNDNAQNSLASCRIQSINEDAAQTLIPNICIPSNLAFHMPDALNIHPQAYLEALYLACETLAKDVSKVGLAEKEINFHIALDQKVNTYPTVRGFTAIGTGGDDFMQAMVVTVESVLLHPIPRLLNESGMLTKRKLNQSCQAMVALLVKRFQKVTVGNDCDHVRNLTIIFSILQNLVSLAFDQIN